MVFRHFRRMTQDITSLPVRGVASMHDGPNSEFT